MVKLKNRVAMSITVNTVTSLHQKKNYKLPEFLLPEEVTIAMAQRIIAYKQKISEQWLEK